MAGDERGAAERDARDTAMVRAARAAGSSRKLTRRQRDDATTTCTAARMEIRPEKITASYFDLVAVGTPRKLSGVAARYHEIGAKIKCC